MSPSTLLTLALSFGLVAAEAHAAMAALVRQYVGSNASGQPVLVCVYTAGQQQFERVYPVGNFCPAYAEA